MGIGGGYQAELLFSLWECWLHRHTTAQPLSKGEECCGMPPWCPFGVVTSVSWEVQNLRLARELLVHGACSLPQAALITQAWPPHLHLPGGQMALCSSVGGQQVVELMAPLCQGKSTFCSEPEMESEPRGYPNLLSPAGGLRLLLWRGGSGCCLRPSSCSWERASRPAFQLGDCSRSTQESGSSPPLSTVTWQVFQVAIENIKKKKYQLAVVHYC